MSEPTNNNGADPATSPYEPKQFRRGELTAGGCALIALGLLILLPSGLCTAIMGYAVVTEGLGNDLEGLNFLITFLVVALIGAALVYAGWHARKKG
jgi:membrane protein implicated in regulation of membrane protease activity